MRHASEPVSPSPAVRATPPDASSELLDYIGAGGRRLRYRVVEPTAELRPDRRERHRLLVLHGIESHGGWFADTARALAARG